MYNSFEDKRIRLFAPPASSLTALEASGNSIISKEYGELIDFQSGCWAAVIGHNRPEILDIILKNTSLFHTHQFFDTEYPSAVVKELTQAANLKNSYKGTFLSSGSEAVSLAITLAGLISGKRKKLCFKISYLGATPELRLPRNDQEWIDLDISECLHCLKAFSCKDCKKFNFIDFSQLAAFVFEPGNSGGLVLCPPDKLIAHLAEETRRAGGYIIVNEVTTGFGRTGKWFGFQHYEALTSEATAPDFISVGKGLGNGYPISGLLVKSDLAAMIEATGFRYVQSHSDDPLGCCVARGVIEIMVRDNLVAKGNSMGEYLRLRLSEVAEKTKKISEVRGRGLMNILLLDESCKANEVFSRLLQNGVFAGYSELYNLIQLYPPLTIGVQDINKLCDVLLCILSSS